MKELLRKIAARDVKIGVIGLGYVGLPLAVEFGKLVTVRGFDLKKDRLDALRGGTDETLETSREELAAAKNLHYTDEPDDLRDCDCFLVTVPTPVDRYNQPDLTPLRRASETVGRVMKHGALVIYESTVFPGCTEEECVPVLEQFSGMKFNKEFFCGYSPERINPGDREHSLTRITKVVSGSTPDAADAVEQLYALILHGKTYRAASLKVAEAAKVIENSQRDLNIAFVNELSKIFRLIGIDTQDVLAAARTKWNFLDFRPGLVGGHCIGVDPFYLTHKAQELGYQPEVILAGRRINDGMGQYAAAELVKLMIRRGHKILGAKVLQLGITFKENCPDTRNSKAIDVTRALQEFGCSVTLLDPCADPDEVRAVYGVTSIRSADDLPRHAFDAVVLAVAHAPFQQLVFADFMHENSVLFDIKGILPRETVDGRL